MKWIEWLPENKQALKWYICSCLDNLLQTRLNLRSCQCVTLKPPRLSGAVHHGALTTCQRVASCSHWIHVCYDDLNSGWYSGQNTTNCMCNLTRTSTAVHCFFSFTRQNISLHRVAAQDRPGFYFSRRLFIQRQAELMISGTNVPLTTLTRNQQLHPTEAF